MQCDILEFFKSLEDPRRKQGLRHQFHDILTIIIMAILSGHQGIRGFHRFADANATELTDTLNLKYGVPGYSTFRDMVNSLDNQILVTKFIAWAKKYIPATADEFIALDGKVVKATTTGGQTKLQNFVSIVNAFGHHSGFVYGMKSFQNGKSGEAQALRDLVEELGLKDKVFTMDALHAQKKLST